MVAGAAAAHDVPADLMLAIAHVEGGLRLPMTRVVDEGDAVRFAGVLELRHARYDSLARGAELCGRTELEIEADLALGTDAGARVLDDLARGSALNRGDLASFASVVEELSGYGAARARIDYRARVFSVLRHGGVLPARGGESIVLPPHPEIPLGLTLSPPSAATLGEAEYPGAEWFETSCDGKCDEYRDVDVTMIAIHDTEGGWDASVSTLQYDAGKSVHYIIDADGGRVGQFIPESYTGWHGGNYYYNQRMVGIEHVGYAGEDDYQTAMYEKSADLVRAIAGRHGIPLDRSHIVGHQEIPNGSVISESSPPCSASPGTCVGDESYGGAAHHTDPGVNWEWCQYMSLVGGSCKCNDAWELWNCVHDLSMEVRCKDGEVEIIQCADTCVVEPIGVDDHCTPIASQASVTTGAGGAGGSDVTAGVGGSSGAFMDEGGGGGAMDNGGLEGSSCAAGSPESSGAGWILGLALGGLFCARRHA